MTGDFVTAAQIIAGTGATGWFADKLLGPSVAGLGDMMKAYSGDRLRKIFGRASQKVAAEDLKALPPGFAITFMQKASFSEDEEILTEMWANLLSSAATKFESRQSAYVEILSQLTSSDARVLDEVLPLGGEKKYEPGRAVNERIEMKVRLAKGIKNISDSQEAGLIEVQRLLHLDMEWPGRVNSARVYFTDEGKSEVVSGGNADQSANQDNLVRLGLLERFEISNSLTPSDVGFNGVFLTTLGLTFVQACRMGIE